MPEPLSHYATDDNHGQHNLGRFLVQSEIPGSPIILSFYPLLDAQSSKSHPISPVASPVNIRLKPSRPLVLGRKYEKYLPPQPGGYDTVSKRHAIIWLEDGYKVMCICVVCVVPY